MFRPMGKLRLLSSHGTRSSLTSCANRLEPHRLIIGKTLENITMPNHLAARIQERSLQARFGSSVHVTRI